MIRFDLAHKNFIDHLKDKDRAGATVIAYAKDIEQLLNFIKNNKDKKLVHEIILEDLEHYMEDLAKNEYTPKSISRKTNSTKTFFKFLIAEGHIKEDPAKELKHPEVELKDPRILSRIEYGALRDTVRKDFRTAAIVELLLQTGIRIGELAEIRLNELNFENQTLSIPKRGKHSEREVPLNNAVVTAIKSYMEIRPKSKTTYLFITKTGNQLLVRNIRATLDRFFRIAGVKDVKVNDLRHTFIAHHLKKGAPLTDVSKIAGHKRLSTTEKYLAYVDRPEKEIVELVEL